MSNSTVRSSLSVGALLELHTAHKSVDTLFDRLTSHIGDLDATVHHLHEKLNEKQKLIDELEEKLALQQERFELAKQRSEPPKRWWQLWR